MAYAVKEIHYTLQGEGIHAGRPAVFLRFSGCNLWSGREEDRPSGPGSCARWCDTDFVGTNGPRGGRFDSAQDLAQAAAQAWPNGAGVRFIVCTGGEPLLQLDTELIQALHREGFQVAIESNGTRPVPEGVDWVCISPKAGTPLVTQQGNELKLVFPQADLPPEAVANLPFQHFLLQPLDGPDHDAHVRAVVAYCLAHPQWRLSLQTHKLLRIP